jgi:hypothetical protein
MIQVCRSPFSRLSEAVFAFAVSVNRSHLIMNRKGKLLGPSGAEALYFGQYSTAGSRALPKTDL